MPMQQWEIECKDAADRDRKVKVRVVDGVLSILTPPGGSARFTPHQAEQFAAAFFTARDECRPRLVRT